VNSKNAILKRIMFFIQWLIALYALLGDGTGLLEKGNEAYGPAVAYGYALSQYFDGWGIEKLFLAAGVGAVFYLAANAPAIKSRQLESFSVFLAVCAVFGRSYLNYNSWDYIFGSKAQFMVALFIMAGYYFVFLHFFALGATVLQKKTGWFRTEAGNRVENLIFEEKPFGAVFIIALLGQLPYVVAFFPGTLHCDALEQLWRYFGVIEMNGHHPVFSTLFMGKCIDLGKLLFQSDSIGFFFYTGGHWVLQSAAIAYMMLFFRKIKSPVALRWFTLAYFLILPVFPMWGLTFAKDTPYYIFTMFFVTTLANVLYDCRAGGKTAWQHYLILAAGALGMVITRNNGIYVVVITAAAYLFLYRRKWKAWLLLAGICLCTYLCVEKAYLPFRGIEPGEIGEALSIPLQQTARYIVRHGEEISSKERDVLEELFDAELSEIAEQYDPEVSDPVKAMFVAHPSREQLTAYVRVWLKQLLKHPDTYIQAFLNQNYGYFYPNRREIQPDLFIFYFNGSEKWEDGNLVLEHAIKNTAVRKHLENYCYFLYSMPVIGMLFGVGLYVYQLLGETVYLMAVKRKRHIALLIPSLCILLICLASPVNAKVRYMLPVMAVLPVNIAWCIQAVKKEGE